MIWWKEYAVPVAVTTGMHILLLTWLASDFSGKPELPDIKEKKFIKERVVQ